MADKTMEEELLEEGVVAAYIYRPNRVFAKQSDGTYVSVDIVSDGTTEDLIQQITTVGEAQIQAVRTTGVEQQEAIRENEDIYAAVKANVLQTYTELKEYYDERGMASLSRIMANAINTLNNIG